MTRAIDITARIERDEVSIKLPRLRVEVSRRQAERLRDALNTILPPNSEQAARPHLLTIYGDVEPELHEYESEAERLEAARVYRRNHGPDDGLYRVDVAGTGKVTVDTFSGGELEPSRRCVLCRCDATAEAYGLPVCGYHVDHTEDDPQCPRCAADAEQLENARLLVAVGDRVRDPQDGAWREIVRIDDDEGTAYMRDGGCMSVRECAAAEKRLPSESLCPACEAWADGGRILTEEQWAAAVDELCIECGATGRTKGMHS